MNAGLLLGFVVTAVVIIVVPGPAVLFTLGRSIAFGRRAGIVSVAGVTAASLALLAVGAAGLGALLTASPITMLVIKYDGAAYLLYLGVVTIVRRRRHAAVEFHPASRPPLARIFRQGFTVGVTRAESNGMPVGAIDPCPGIVIGTEKPGGGATDAPGPGPYITGGVLAMGAPYPASCPPQVAQGAPP